MVLVDFSYPLLQYSFFLKKLHFSFTKLFKVEIEYLGSCIDFSLTQIYSILCIVVLFVCWFVSSVVSKYEEIEK